MGAEKLIELKFPDHFGHLGRPGPPQLSEYQVPLSQQVGLTQEPVAVPRLWSESSSHRKCYLKGWGKRRLSSPLRCPEGHEGGAGRRVVSQVG